MLYFDIDNVLRDFMTAVFGYAPKEWVAKVEGKSVMKYVEENLHLLEQAPATEYLDLIVKYYKETGEVLKVLTCQPISWRSYTNRWLDKHIDCIFRTIYVVKPADKLKYLGEGDFLIDDNPVYDGQDKVILVDLPYNQHCKNGKIKGVKEMNRFLRLGIESKSFYKIAREIDEVLEKEDG